VCFLFGHVCNIIITLVAYTFLKLKQDTFFIKQKGVAECFRKSGREAKSSQGILVLVTIRLIVIVLVSLQCHAHLIVFY